jgi:hypothetical protein
MRHSRFVVIFGPFKDIELQGVCWLVEMKFQLHKLYKITFIYMTLLVPSNHSTTAVRSYCSLEEISLLWLARHFDFPITWQLLLYFKLVFTRLQSRWSPRQQDMSSYDTQMRGPKMTTNLECRNEDKQFLKQMNSEFKRDSTGSWVAPLPFRSPRQSLPNNRKQAVKRAKYLDSSLRRNPKKREHMVEFMQKIVCWLARHSDFPITWQLLLYFKLVFTRL